MLDNRGIDTTSIDEEEIAFIEEQALLSKQEHDFHEQKNQRKIENLKKQAYLLKKENEFLKQQNQQVIQENNSLQTKSELLEENTHLWEANYAVLQENYEWLEQDLKLSKKVNSDLLKLLDSQVSSDEQTLHEEYKTSPEFFFQNTDDDSQFGKLKSQMQELQNAFNAHEALVDEKLTRQKQELEDKIEERVLILLEEQKKWQQQTLEALRGSFQQSFNILQQDENINTLTNEIHDLQNAVLEKLENITSNTDNLENKNELLLNEFNKTKTELNEKIESLLESDVVQDAVNQLQTKVFAEIQNEQAATATILNHLSLLDNKYDLLEQQQGPMYKIYQLKTTKLLEQKAILEHEKSRVFYNTFYKVFSAKLIAAIVLSSELVKHDDRMTDKMGKLGGSLIGATLGGAIPFVGNLVDSITSFLIEEGVGKIKGKIQAKKSENTTESVTSLDQAMKIAELVARRLTQKYMDEECNHDNEEIEKKAINCAKGLYNFIKKGHLLPHKDSSNEYKISILLKEVANQKMLEEHSFIPFIEDDENDKDKEETHHFRKKLRHSLHVLLTRKEKPVKKYDDRSLRQKHKSTSDAIELTREFSSLHINRLKREVSESKLENQTLHEKVKSLQNDTSQLKEEVARLHTLLEQQPLQSHAERTETPYSKANMFAKPNKQEKKVKMEKKEKTENTSNQKRSIVKTALQNFQHRT